MSCPVTLYFSYPISFYSLLRYPIPVTPDHISTRQYARLVDEWVTGIGLRREDYSTHSLRRTKASIIYKQTGNLRAVQILLGHTEDREHGSLPRRRYRGCPRSG
jgi:integrase